jgi:hypothetical protein
MDLTVLVAVAHRRLKLRRMLMAIERDPTLLETEEMATPFLQGLTKAMDMLEHNLEEDAKGLMKKIERVGDRGKEAMTKAHARMDGVASRIAEVDKFVTAIEGSNGGEALGNSSDSSKGESSEQGKQQQPQEEPQGEPEKLTVNGVSGG